MSQISARLVGAWAVFVLQTVCACSVEVQGTGEEPICYGPNCPDADVVSTDDMRPSDAAALPTSRPDASPPVIDLCPGMCLPDNPSSCSDKSSDDLSASDSAFAHSAFESSAAHMQVAYRGQLQLDSGLLGLSFDAGGSVAEGDAAASGSSDAGEAVAADDVPGSEPTHEPEGDASSTPTADAADAEAADAAEAGSDSGYGDLGPVVPPAVDAAIDAPARPSTMACQLLPDEQGKAHASCDVAGGGAEGSSCISSADCAPGLGCVGDASGVGATCMNYCCEGDQSCPLDRFCSRRPLKTAIATQEPVMIPVCAPSEQCDLMDPYPCPDDNCKCPSGTACSPVGRDGARRCVAPGGATDGEACPCAAGYFCSSANVCLKVCQLEGDDCGAKVCQASGGFPEQWGLCVEVPIPAAVP